MQHSAVGSPAPFYVLRITDKFSAMHTSLSGYTIYRYVVCILAAFLFYHLLLDFLDFCSFTDFVYT